jgi:hypothetical protein
MWFLLRAETAQDWNPVGGSRVSFLHSYPSRMALVLNWSSIQSVLGLGKSGRGMAMTIHWCLVPRLRMGSAVHLLHCLFFHWHVVRWHLPWKVYLLIYSYNWTRCVNETFLKEDRNLVFFSEFQCYLKAYYKVCINYQRISLHHNLSRKCYKIVKFMSITHNEHKVWNGRIVAIVISRGKCKPV